MDVAAVNVALGHLKKDARKQIEIIEACKALETASQFLATIDATESKLNKVKDEIWQLEKQRVATEKQYRNDLANFDAQLQAHRESEEARVAAELKVVQDELDNARGRMVIQETQHKDRLTAMQKDVQAMEELRTTKSVALQKVQSQIDALRS